MTRPEAFVIIFSCWLSIWRRLALADGSQIVGGEEVTLQAGGAVVFGEPANIVLARTDRGHVEEVAAIRQVVLDLGLRTSQAPVSYTGIENPSRTFQICPACRSPRPATGSSCPRRCRTCASAPDGACLDGHWPRRPRPDAAHSDATAARSSRCRQTSPPWRQCRRHRNRCKAPATPACRSASSRNGPWCRRRRSPRRRVLVIQADLWRIVGVRRHSAARGAGREVVEGRGLFAGHGSLYRGLAGQSSRLEVVEEGRILRRPTDEKSALPFSPRA